MTATLFAVTACFMLLVSTFLIANHVRGVITMSLQDTVNAVVAQLNHAKAEILDKVEKLEADLAAAGMAGAVDVSELVAAAQALDDIVPDEIVPVEDEDTVEVPEPVVEGVVEVEE